MLVKHLQEDPGDAVGITCLVLGKERRSRMATAFVGVDEIP